MSMQILKKKKENGIPKLYTYIYLHICLFSMADRPMDEINLQKNFNRISRIAAEKFLFPPYQCYQSDGWSFLTNKEKLRDKKIILYLIKNEIQKKGQDGPSKVRAPHGVPCRIRKEFRIGPRRDQKQKKNTPLFKKKRYISNFDVLFKNLKSKHNVNSTRLRLPYFVCKLKCLCFFLMHIIVTKCLFFVKAILLVLELEVSVVIFIYIFKK